MMSYEFRGYLAALADSDLFGTIAILCGVIALLGLIRRVREGLTYRVVSFLLLMSIFALHALGSYYLSTNPA